MENDEKNSAVVLAVFIVVVLLCIGAYLLLKNKNNKVTEDANIQALSKDIVEVENLDEIVSKSKFVSDQKEVKLDEDFGEGHNILVKIEDQTIAIRTAKRSVNVTSIKDPVAVGTFYVGGEDSLPVDVYVLNKENKLYHIKFYAADFERDQTVKVVQFALSDVESFSTAVVDLENHEMWTNFVVAKTKDGKYYTDYHFNKDSEYTFRQIVSKGKEEIVVDENAVNFGLLSTKDINPFKSLDFNKRISGNEDYEMNFDSIGITITVPDEDIDKTIKLNIKNIKQIALSCMCGGCDSIYYLTDGGELYDIHFDHQSGIESLEDADLKEITKLVAKKVKYFTLLDLSKIDPTTCGGYYVVYRNNDNKEIIIYGEKEYDTKSFERLVIPESVFDGINSTEGSELYVVSKNVSVKNYLKDPNGKNLVAKNIYLFSGQSEDGNGEYFFYLYVLNEDNYLYHFENYTNKKAELVSKSKVKNITKRDDDIVVTFEDDKEQIIDAYEFEIK